MCGIWAYICRSSESPKLTHQEMWAKGVKTLQARGPEDYRFTDIYIKPASCGAYSVTPHHVIGTFAFTRLAINGLNTAGMQPFRSDNDKITWMCNGEIYNSHELKIPMPSGSDCEVLGPLWERCEGDAIAFARALDGVFSIILHDSERGKFVIARDPYGVRPLYYFSTTDGSFVFGSERKSLEGFYEELDGYNGIVEFPPGQVWELSEEGLSWNKPVTYHTVPWIKMADTMGWEERLREALVAAVRKRLLTERPVAALLSGGLDSSLIASLVQKELKALGKPPLKTFSIGMPGSTDLKYARMVADYIGSDHTEILTSAEEMFAAIPQVIHDIESYDITTVRASVGNWLVSKKIRELTDCKVVFNGDGSDEVFGSYLYFFNAPSDETFERESERLLKEISKYDVLRSDRSISSHGLEPRTPFLDKQFVAVAMSLPTHLRRPSCSKEGQPKGWEKYALRVAMNIPFLLPDEVLWRRKEAFSDGVSSQEKSWYQEIQERVGRLICDDWEEKALDFLESKRGINSKQGPLPKTKEAYYYRLIFENHYKNTGDYWPFWMPRWTPGATDPSARTLKVYDALK
jgi:asparagine synthase (glutamine-hydrolysing)